jgi:GMP synthase-like glutamine amidotransferase
MRLHYIQHVPFENPGSILAWADRNGFDIACTRVYADAGFPPQNAFDWLVVMGGPMNIYEEERYPWLVDEKRFIGETIQNEKVVIGLCLGGQLIADVLGGKVTKNAQREIGWFTVRMTETAKQHPLFRFFPENPVVFQWHGDTFSTLPKEAELLASSAACAHQAFVYRNRVFGFQYHLENTEEIIRGLIDNCGDELIVADTVQTAEELLAHPEYIAQDNVWMTEFLSRLLDTYRKGAL